MENFLPARLRELRGATSQSDFASKIGVKQTSYSSWERGIKDPAAQTVAQIASTFGVSADWLLGLPERGVGARVEAGKGAAVSIGSGTATASNCRDCPILLDFIKRRSGG
ncbi:MAG: helix-turn-helix transcriptional regulator [Kiritimatiellae bacterium]|nr:helix-turn-helix transcriptional regulator [Kiritimatiellia bacterium]